jgi:hypothetical protein
MSLFVIDGCFSSGSIDQILVEYNSTHSDAYCQFSYMWNNCIYSLARPRLVRVFLEDELAVIFTNLFCGSLVANLNHYVCIIDVMFRDYTIVVLHLKWNNFVTRTTNTALGKMAHHIWQYTRRSITWLHIDIVCPRISNCWTHLDSINKVLSHNKNWSSNLRISLVWICESRHLQMIWKCKSKQAKLWDVYSFTLLEIPSYVCSKRIPYFNR